MFFSGEFLRDANTHCNMCVKYTKSWKTSKRAPKEAMTYALNYVNSWMSAGIIVNNWNLN